MNTLKEVKDILKSREEGKWDIITPEQAEWYYNWYKDAIEWIFNDITNSSTLSVEGIERYLQDLINK